jgi:hypothetical protein
MTSRWRFKTTFEAAHVRFLTRSEQRNCSDTMSFCFGVVSFFSCGCFALLNRKGDSSQNAIGQLWVRFGSSPIKALK